MENQTPEDVNVFLGSPRLYKSTDLTERCDEDFHLSWPVIYSSAVVTTTSPDASLIFNHVANMFRWISKGHEPAEPTIHLDVDLHWHPHVISPLYAGLTTYEPENLTTTNLVIEVFRKAVSQAMHRREILDRLDVIAQREDNWDGYDSKKPTQLTLNHAEKFVVDLLTSVIFAGHSWRMPFISSDEDGYITVEWYEEERELHLLIEENEAEYLQVWGTNIDTDMDEGFLNRDNFLTLWEWLLDE